MKTVTQIDHPTHTTNRKERERALKVLEKAKQIPRPVVFLKKGQKMIELNKRK